jgi:hypothetical protein
LTEKKKRDVLLPFICNFASEYAIRKVYICNTFGPKTCLVCPEVVDGGEGLWIWRAAANILKKQSQTADEGWSSSLEVGHGANNQVSSVGIREV